MKTLLPEVERLVDEWTDLIVSGFPEDGAICQATGPATAGKSSLLGELEQRLLREGRHAVRVAPPAAALDAGPAALLEIGGALKDQNVLNGEVEKLVDPERPWQDKIQLVRSWFDELGPDAVLLCDEPLDWGRREVDDRFAAHGRDVSDLVFDLNCVRVIGGRLPDAHRASVSARLQRESDPMAWLQDREEWGELADVAEALAEGAAYLVDYSPLEIRLFVAHAVVTTPADVLAWVSDMQSRRAISRRLLDRLNGRSAFRPLAQVWERLAVVRRSIPDELLTTLGENQLGDLMKSVLRHCILYPSGGEYVLHETLRADAEGRLSEPTRKGTHRTLVEHYRAVFGGLDGVEHRRALVAELEAFHHATATGDVELVDDCRVFFVDQLDALGRWLSYEEHKYSAAVDVFRRSLAWDGDDDYAHHYLAYNLDIQGIEPGKVEEHYQEALNRNDEHSWWWARYINFLIVRGRTDDARREWDNALDALLPAEGDEYLYNHLHMWILPTLLHRGQVDFANAVLADIPHSVREGDIALGATARRLRALIDARDNGALVPIDRLGHKWWLGKPELLPEVLEPGTQRQKWLAGRIDAIQDDVLYLWVGEVSPGQSSRPRGARTKMSFDEFNQMSPNREASELSPGMFVEIGLYTKPGRRKPKTTTLARVHEKELWEDDGLPRTTPDPKRYLSKLSVKA